MFIMLNINNKKINIFKNWLNGSEKFKFPYITEVNGKKMINFEEKDFKDFLINEVGLLSYVAEIPAQEDIMRHNSTIHFSDPKSLIQPASPISVSEKNVIDDPNAVKDAVKNAINNNKPEENTPKTTKIGKVFKAPSYEEIYEKTCK